MSIALPVRSQFGFARTVCACEECTFNCRFLPGMLSPQDLELYLGSVEPDVRLLWAERNLLASPGAKVITGAEIITIRTLVPARKADGSCIHLNAASLCDIHKISPAGCSLTDAHIGSYHVNQRSMAILKSVLNAWRAYECGDRGYGPHLSYPSIWKHLHAAGLVTPPIAETRARMSEEWDRLMMSRQ